MAEGRQRIIPEASYPLSFRTKETADILKILGQRQSFTLVGMKRVGVSNFLRFIAFNPKIQEKLGSRQDTLFVYLDANDLTEIEPNLFWLLLLKRLKDVAIHLDASRREEVEEIYKNLSTSENREPLFLLEGVKEIAQIFAESDCYLVLVLARFDRLLPLFSEQFFANLQSIIDVALQHITYVFTSYLPLDLLCKEIYFAATFSMFTKTYYLQPGNREDLTPVITGFEAQHGLSIPERVKDILISLTGGHVQLLQLSLISVSQQLLSPKTDAPTLLLTLSSDERIQLQCEEIFASLTEAERSFLLQDKHAPAKPTPYLLETGLVNDNGQVFSEIFARFLEQKKKELRQHSLPLGQLTQKETSLLNYFVSHKGEVCSRDDLIGAVWPEFEDISDWALDQLVSRLRKKLELYALPMKVKTNRGVGYELIEADS